MSEGRKPVRVWMTDEEWDKFQKIRANFILQDPKFDATYQGTFIRLIEKYYEMVEGEK